MSQDTTSNVWYILGVIGSVLYVIAAAYLLATHFMTLPDYILIMDWVANFGLILFALAFVGIYRDIDNFIPIFALIFFLIVAIIAALVRLGILVAELVPFWAIWIILIVAFLLAGFSVWKTQDQIGGFAKITAIIFIIWGFIQAVLRFLDYGLGPSIYDQLLFAGTIIIYLIAFIYFIRAIRS
jgi:hypothetical protein